MHDAPLVAVSHRCHELARQGTNGWRGEAARAFLEALKTGAVGNELKYQALHRAVGAVLGGRCEDVEKLDDVGVRSSRLRERAQQLDLATLSLLHVLQHFFVVVVGAFELL